MTDVNSSVSFGVLSVCFFNKVTFRFNLLRSRSLSASLFVSLLAFSSSFIFRFVFLFVVLVVVP